MLLLYNSAILLYSFIIRLATLFNKKAALWFYGRKNQSLIRYPHSIWFHFSSLGEFEQGRPVLEQFRKLYPEKKIVVTFFSPSGYEVRKNSPLADAVYYLPLDTKKNAANFLDTIQPQLAIFTKYEYWYHFFNQAHQREIPIYVISAIFRPKQVFFKWYGSLHRKILSFVNYFFVQDESSIELLKSIKITKAIISGDTRFDRVWQNALSPKGVPLIEEFKNLHKILIAGSTWPQDEKLVARLAFAYPDWKFIFAPHEIEEEKIKILIELLPLNSAIRYSQLSSSHSCLTNQQTLIIDNIGMLSSLYQYADIAFIGGGFGAGIHNTLEAAAFGVPVIFGPEYSKFKEAHDLVALKAGFSIANEKELEKVMGVLVNDEAFYNEACTKSSVYVQDHTGATKTIISYITNNI